MDKYCFGVDLGGTTVKIGLFSIEGQVGNSYKNRESWCRNPQ